MERTAVTRRSGGVIRQGCSHPAGFDTLPRLS